MRGWAACALALAFACTKEPDYEGLLCGFGSPCPSGYGCGADDRCHRFPFADASVPDAAPRDADAQPLDAEPIDAEPIDAEPLDSGMHEVQVAIAGAGDDALQDPGGPMLIAYGWISLYDADHWGATRFVVPELPPGATIDEAFLEVFVDSDTEDMPNVVLHTEPTPAPLALAMADSDISSRLVSTASVAWIANDIGPGWRESPDVAAIVREVTDRSDWTPGSALMFIWDAQAPNFEVRQWDYDQAGGFAAKLTIHYSVP